MLNARVTTKKTQLLNYYDRDPFRRGDNILVMCETLCPDGSPHPTNHRYGCKDKMDQASAHKPWFGIEQVCFIQFSFLF